MARLPVPGSDDGNWGEILNEFLKAEHNQDGTLKLDGTLASKYTKPAGGIPRSDLRVSVQDSLDRADIASDRSSHNGTQPSSTISDFGPAVESKARLSLTADVPVMYDSSQGRISLPKATAGQSGYLDAADWTFFNSKQDALGYTPLDAAGGIIVGNLGISGSMTNNLTPISSGLYSLGSSVNYWSTTYSNKFYLNNKAFIDGATEGKIIINTGTLSQVSNIPMIGNDAAGYSLNVTATTPYASGGLYGLTLASNGGKTPYGSTSSLIAGAKFNGRFGINNAGTVGTLYGGWFVAEHNGSGSLTNASAGRFSYYRNVGNGPVNNVNVVQVDVNGSGSGEIGTLVGMNIQSITQANVNYAIYTNAGKVRFGDSVEIQDGKSIVAGSNAGLRLGTSVTQKIGFYNTAPVAQQSGGQLIAGTSYTDNEQNMLNKMFVALRNIGILS